MSEITTVDVGQRQRTTMARAIRFMRQHPFSSNESLAKEFGAIACETREIERMRMAEWLLNDAARMFPKDERAAQVCIELARHLDEFGCTPLVKRVKVRR